MSSPNDSTPDGAESDSSARITEPLSNTTEPMIIDGEAMDHDEVAAPLVRPRNGMANAGMLLGIASLIVNPLAISSVAAIILSIIGLRKALAMFRASGDSVGRFPATIGLALGAATAVFAIFVYFNPPVVG